MTFNNDLTRMLASGKNVALLQKIAEEASGLKPFPITEHQLRSFLRKVKHLDDADLLEAWEIRKSKHLLYLQDRHGLTDARPFKLKPGEFAFGFSWLITGSNYFVSLDFKQEPTMQVTGSCPMPKKKVCELLVAYCKKLSADPPKLDYNALPTEGKLALFEHDEPEHDWVIWRSNMEYAYPELPSRVIFKHIKRYKTGEHWATNLAELEQAIVNELPKDIAKGAKSS